MTDFLAIDLASLARVAGGLSNSEQPPPPAEPEPPERLRCTWYPDGKVVCKRIRPPLTT